MAFNQNDNGNFNSRPLKIMKIIKTDLGERSYKILIGNNAIAKLASEIKKLHIGSSAYIITNPIIKNKCAPLLKKSLKNSGIDIKFKSIPDTEKSKSLKTAYSVINDLTYYDKKKPIFIAALGGGVVGDLSGFVASIYKRGINYIQIPTTLLAQVDSAIGGKTAIDLTEGKNLIGAFYQPRMVLSDIALLKTLNQRQIRSGLAEIIKYGLIKDAGLFGYLEKHWQDILKQKPSVLEFVISRCSMIKAKIVSQDEKETKGIRTILNFGHTIGHAIETAAKYKNYSHGEAIALGMLVACSISQKLKLINNKTSERIELLMANVGLPVKIKGITLDKIIKAHYYDKKFIGNKNRFVLIKRIGKTKIVKNIPLKLIEEAIRERF